MHPCRGGRVAQAVLGRATQGRSLSPVQTIEEHCCMQGIMYGGQSTEGHLGDAWLLDSGTMTWQQTATTDFGGFSDAAKAWHAAAVLKCTDVRPPGLLEAHLSEEVAAAILCWMCQHTLCFCNNSFTQRRQSSIAVCTGASECFNQAQKDDCPEGRPSCHAWLSGNVALLDERKKGLQLTCQCAHAIRVDGQDDLYTALPLHALRCAGRPAGGVWRGAQRSSRATRQGGAG